MIAIQKRQILISGNCYYLANEIMGDLVNATLLFTTDKRYRSSVGYTDTFTSRAFGLPTEQDMHKYKLFLSGNEL